MDEYFETLNKRSKTKANYSLFSELLTRTLFKKLFTDMNLVEDSSLFIEILLTWWEVIPSSGRTTLLHQHLLPKLVIECEKWQPTADKTPIHKWLTGYFSLFEKIDPNPRTSFQECSHIVQRKIGNCLEQGWDVHDTTAVQLLTPLVEIWTLDAWRVFYNKFITPKMKRHLMGINYKDFTKSLIQFKLFSCWWELLEVTIIDSILDEVFFPSFFQQFHKEISNSDEEEIAEWYWAWREELSPLLFLSRKVVDNLTRILQSMSKAYKLRHTKEEQVKQPVRQSLREFIEAKCLKENIVFLPGKNAHGRQMYKIGVHWCYIERNVLFKNSTNEPVSLHSLSSLSKV